MAAIANFLAHELKHELNGHAPSDSTHSDVELAPRIGSRKPVDVPSGLSPEPLVPIFVAVRSTDGLHQPPSFLARLLALEVWGPYLLSSRARYEMNAAATLLLAVFLFEMLAWTLLFNVILHASRWEVSALSLLAVGFAFLFATVVFLYERGFITSDFSSAGNNSTSGKNGRIAAVSIRLIVIVATALATAQPLELLVFGQEIDSRLKEEGVWKEALHQLTLLEKDQSDSISPGRAKIEEDLKDTTQAKDLQSARDAVKAAETREGEVQAEVTAATQTASRAKSYLDLLQRQLGALNRGQASGDPETIRKKIDQAAVRYEQRRGELQTAENSRSAAATDLDNARQREASALKAWNELVNTMAGQDRSVRNEAKSSANARRDWIDHIHGKKTCDPIPSPMEPDKLWDPCDAGFITRLSILDDLLNARRPFWSSSERAQRQKVVATFGLPDPEASDDATHRREAFRAQTLNNVYRISFIIAVVIPLLTIAFKLLMARELAIYYSAKAQARAGNPHAIQVISAQQDVD